MNANQLREKLSEWTFDGGRRSASFALDGWTVTVNADLNAPIAGLVWDLTLGGGPTAQPGLKAWGEAIAKSASGLMESLRLIEVDEARGEALLRSDTPSRAGSEASYYEVLLQGLAKATVRRFKADVKAGTPREQVSFAITHESLAKLAADIAS
jgi:hypothetical protein